MNRYAREVIREFCSAENREYLEDAVRRRYPSMRVKNFLADHLDSAISHFAESIQSELAMSTPLRGTTIFDQLNTYNDQFISQRIHAIRTHVEGPAVPLYAVTDGMATSRATVAQHQAHPNSILDSWRVNPGRTPQMREDEQGYDSNPYYGGGSGDGSRLRTGIVFCDQREYGTQNHVEQYENTSYKHALNNHGPATHEDTPFGVSTPSADARLLSRRTFRRNEAGVENGIARYEARLYNRPIERDISEGLRADSRNYSYDRSATITGGYDMSTLHARIAHKRAGQAQYRPGCGADPTMRLYSESQPPDDFRYY